MIRTEIPAPAPRACVVDCATHSEDLTEVYHGRTEPAYACGYHYTYFPELVFLAHNEAIRKAA